MLRALFIEFPDDPGAWLVDNQYMFGSDMLVAPLFSDELHRDVYLPKGDWVDYQTGESYTGGWHRIKSGAIPVVSMVRAGAIIPHIKLAQSTAFMDWSAIDLKVYGAKKRASGKVVIPGGSLEELRVTMKDGKAILESNAYDEMVKFKIIY
jgi:alpha-D-xyloside xylohydrolase